MQRLVTAIMIAFVCVATAHVASAAVIMEYEVFVNTSSAGNLALEAHDDSMLIAVALMRSSTDTGTVTVDGTGMQSLGIQNFSNRGALQFFALPLGDTLGGPTAYTVSAGSSIRTQFYQLSGANQMVDDISVIYFDTGTGSGTNPIPVNIDTSPDSFGTGSFLAALAAVGKDDNTLPTTFSGNDADGAVTFVKTEDNLNYNDTRGSWAYAEGISGTLDTTATITSTGYNGTATAGYGFIVVEEFIIPEPASLGLIGLGAVALLARRRRTA